MRLTQRYLWLVLLFFCGNLFAQARYRVDQKYEDTVRIVIIWNDASGLSSCNSATKPVGQQTMEFILNALDTLQLPNVKTLKNTTSNHVTWRQVKNLWGGDTIPHTIIHANAGWSTGWNGPELENIFRESVERRIGIVSVGDDAGNLASEVFGFDGVNNVPDPMRDATQIDSLWLGLLRQNDEQVKLYKSDGQLAYPGVNGIISNAVDSILKGSTMMFNPVGDGRCQADADKYTILYPQWITMLGFQQGYWNSRTQPANNDQLNTLVAIQDTTTNKIVRRAVALSFQPQFLRNDAAAQQIIYDAVMYASLTHTLSVANRIEIIVNSDTLKAGEKITMQARLFDQKDSLLNDLLPLVQWQILDAQPGDSISQSSGATTTVTGTKAWREMLVSACVTDPETQATLCTTATVVVMPSDPHHLNLQQQPEVSGTMLNQNTPPIEIKLGDNAASTQLYAVVRDRFDNYIRFANTETVQWSTSNRSAAIVEGKADSSWIGLVIRSGPGTTEVQVREGTLIPANATVNCEDISLLRDAITRDTNGNGYLDRIDLYFTKAVAVDTQEIAQLISFMQGSGKNLRVVGIHPHSSAQDTLWQVELEEVTNLGLQTGWTPVMSGRIPVLINGTVNYVQLPGTMISDGAGPVIQKVTYFPPMLDANSDTLRIKLSEPVLRDILIGVNPSELFNFYRAGDSQTSQSVIGDAVLLLPESGAYTQELIIVRSNANNPDEVIKVHEDSLQFVKGSTDAAGNAPLKIARRVTIELGGSNNLLIAASPNPFSGGTELSPLTRTFYANVLNGIPSPRGVLVAIRARKPLKEYKERFGSAKIFDAVGNCIVSDLPIKMAAGFQDYGLFWNLHTNRGRRVSPGSYLCVVRVTDIDGRSIRETVKIGVSE